MSDWTEDNDPGLRFETVAFEPDGGVPPLGLIVLLLFGIPLAAATGFFNSLGYWIVLDLLWWVPEWHLFMLLVGVAFFLINTPLILFVWLVSGWAKIRNPLVITVAVGCIAAVMLVCALATEILIRRGLGINEFTMDHMVTYITFAAVAAGTVAIMINTSRRNAFKPFCNVCNSWKKVHFQRKLNVPVHVLLRAIQTGDVVPLAELKLRGEGPLTLTVMACPNCQLEASAEVKLEQTYPTTQGHSKTETLAYVSYPGEAAVVLEEIFAQK